MDNALRLVQTKDIDRLLRETVIDWACVLLARQKDYSKLLQLKGSGEAVVEFLDDVGFIEEKVPVLEACGSFWKAAQIEETNLQMSEAARLYEKTDSGDGRDGAARCLTKALWQTIPIGTFDGSRSPVPAANSILARLERYSDRHEIRSMVMFFAAQCLIRTDQQSRQEWLSVS